MYFCEQCKKMIQTESPDETPFQIEGKDACKECFYKAFAEEIAEHPIVSTKFVLRKDTKEENL